jgi:hypothetical protein
MIAELTGNGHHSQSTAGAGYTSCAVRHSCFAAVRRVLGYRKAVREVPKAETEVRTRQRRAAGGSGADSRDAAVLGTSKAVGRATRNLTFRLVLTRLW